MKLFEVLLVEKIVLSKAKKYVKGWDKTRYEDVFRKYTDDDKAYRIYLPLEVGKKPSESAVQKKVANVLNSKGYSISDYIGGYAIEKDKEKPRIMKIGKLISDDTELVKQFASDGVRAAGKKSSLMVVISRHPYDIAGMSTDRGWTSCMNIDKGSMKKYVMADVKEGTIVAYLIDANDKNIQNPTARISIKPFVNINDKKSILLGIENEVYGTNKPGFTETVKKWVKEVNDSKKLDGVFFISSDLYLDDLDSVKVVGKSQETKDMKKLIDDPHHYQNIEKPTIAQTTVFLKSSWDGRYLSWIKNINDLPEDLKDVIVKKFRSGLNKIKNPTQEQLMYGVIGWPDNRKQSIIDKLELATIKKIIKQNLSGILWIPNPSTELLKYAVDSHSNIMDILSVRLELLPAIKDYLLQKRLNNVLKFYPLLAPKDAQIEYIKKNPDNIIAYDNYKIKQYIRKEDMDQKHIDNILYLGLTGLAATNSKKLLKLLIDYEIPIPEDVLLKFVKDNVENVKYLLRPSDKIKKYVIDTDPTNARKLLGGYLNLNLSKYLESRLKSKNEI